MALVEALRMDRPCSAGPHLVQCLADVVDVIASHAPGSFVRVTYERNGEHEDLRVRLGSRLPAPDPLGSLFVLDARSDQDNMHFGLPRPRQNDHSFMRFFNSGDGASQWVIRSHDGQDFEFNLDGLHEGHLDRLHEGHPDGLHEGHLDGLHKGHVDRLHEGHLDGLHEIIDLANLGDGMSLDVTLENGVLTIDRDGEVQVIDVGGKLSGDTVDSTANK